MTQEQNKTPERFPSDVELVAVFDRITEGRKYKALRILRETDDVSLFEIEVLLENGERTEYNYQKATYDTSKPSLPESAQFSASIHAMFYDADGMPISGQSVANYKDGAWEYVSP